MEYTEIEIHETRDITSDKDNEKLIGANTRDKTIDCCLSALLPICIIGLLIVACISIVVVVKLLEDA